MKFLLTITGKPGEDDLDKVTVEYEAKNWRDAAHTADTIKKQLGLKGESVVTYAAHVFEFGDSLLIKSNLGNEDIFATFVSYDAGWLKVRMHGDVATIHPKRVVRHTKKEIAA